MSFFLSGVANADLFYGNQLFSSSKTLLESAITIGVTADDIRAGQGAKLYAKNFHTSVFDLKLTDQMFNIDYIAKNIGSTITIGGDAITEESVTLVANAGSVVGTPVAFGTYGTVGWAALTGTNVWSMVTFTGSAFTISGGGSGTYCVKYFATDSAAKKVVVSANIIPSEVTVVLTANLFNADPNSVGTATKVGKITIKIPRFLLSGSQDLSMTMTGVSQTDISGSALAVAGACGTDDYYAEVVQTLFSANWYDEAVSLSISDAIFTIAPVATRLLQVYAIYPNAAPKLMANSNFTFTSSATGVATVASTGIVTGVGSGTAAITVTITAKPAVEGVAFVTVS